MDCILPPKCNCLTERTSTVGALQAAPVAVAAAEPEEAEGKGTIVIFSVILNIKFRIQNTLLKDH